MKHGEHRPNSCCVKCYRLARQDDDGHMPLKVNPMTVTILKHGTQNFQAMRGLSRRSERGAFDRTW